VDSVPASKEKLSDVGDEITLDDIETGREEET